jgi:hypothetical protein
MADGRIHYLAFPAQRGTSPDAARLFKTRAYGLAQYAVIRTLGSSRKKCRPDWDITAPELKAAWGQGRKDRFYPYGKTYVQTLGERD